MYGGGTSSDHYGLPQLRQSLPTPPSPPLPPPMISSGSQSSFRMLFTPIVNSMIHHGRATVSVSPHPTSLLDRAQTPDAYLSAPDYEPDADITSVPDTVASVDAVDAHDGVDAKRHQQHHDSYSSHPQIGDYAHLDDSGPQPATQLQHQHSEQQHVQPRQQQQQQRQSKPSLILNGLIDDLDESDLAALERIESEHYTGLEIEAAEHEAEIQASIDFEHHFEPRSHTSTQIRARSILLATPTSPATGVVNTSSSTPQHKPFDETIVGSTPLPSGARLSPPIPSSSMVRSTSIVLAGSLSPSSSLPRAVSVAMIEATPTRVWDERNDTRTTVDAVPTLTIATQVPAQSQVHGGNDNNDTNDEPTTLSTVPPPSSPQSQALPRLRSVRPLPTQYRMDPSPSPPPTPLIASVAAAMPVIVATATGVRTTSPLPSTPAATIPLPMDNVPSTPLLPSSSAAAVVPSLLSNTLTTPQQHRSAGSNGESPQEPSPELGAAYGANENGYRFKGQRDPPTTRAERTAKKKGNLPVMPAMPVRTDDRFAPSFLDLCSYHTNWCNDIS
jgi:hypothetical protein